MKHQYSKRAKQAGVAGCMLLAGIVLPFAASGQSLTLTAPLAPVTVADGKEFATSLVQRPWDMNELRDVALDAGFSSILATNGVWYGTSSTNVYYIFPLSPGFVRANYTNYYSWYSPGMPYGPLNPLDAETYSRVSFRMSLNQSERYYISLFWSLQTNEWPAAAGHVATWYDGEPTFTTAGQYAQVTQASGFRIYDADPNASGWLNERNSTLVNPINTAGSPWTGRVFGFQIWPTSQGSAGSQVAFDWIRAYDPDTSPVVPITWSSTLLGGSSDSIQLYVDTDASGFDGDLMVSGLSNDGQYNLKTAALPPGDYYVYLLGVRHTNSALNIAARSGYSALIRITHPPLITITAPSFTSGADYASTELGNPWDFADSSDVYATAQMSWITYSDGILSAVTDDPIAPYIESDDQIWLNTRSGGTVVPIDPSKYCYLTFRMRSNEEAGYEDIFDKVERGWESRVMWWKDGLTDDGSYSKDIPLLEGWNTYTVDLRDNNLNESQEFIPAVPQEGWEELGTVYQLRFDPMEAHIPTQFWLDYITLNAENALQNGAYTVRWSIEDPDSTSLTLRVFADASSSGQPQRSATPVATFSAATGTGSWSWVPGVGLGEYFIRLEASDGTSTSEVTSAVAVNVEPGAETVPVNGDYNGDGVADLAMYEPSTGNWYIRSLTPLDADHPALAFAMNWGNSGMDPVPGDYNGDGVFDLAVYERSTGNWYIRSLAAPEGTPPITFGQNWGNSGMDPVSGDYNGDGVYDLAVYERDTGNWFIRSLGPVSDGNPPITFGQNWGDSGMDPVPGDYSGDGVADLAVYQRDTGNWFIRSLGPVSEGNPPITFGQNWGSSNMSPAFGDYSGDGVADLSVYESSQGRWFIRSLGPVGPDYPPIAFSEWWGGIP